MLIFFKGGGKISVVFNTHCFNRIRPPREVCGLFYLSGYYWKTYPLDVRWIPSKWEICSTYRPGVSSMIWRTKLTACPTPVEDETTLSDRSSTRRFVPTNWTASDRVGLRASTNCRRRRWSFRRRNSTKTFPASVNIQLLFSLSMTLGQDYTLIVF